MLRRHLTPRGLEASREVHGHLQPSGILGPLPWHADCITARMLVAPEDRAPDSTPRHWQGRPSDTPTRPGIRAVRPKIVPPEGAIEEEVVLSRRDPRCED
jgi:hypothetical protein